MKTIAQGLGALALFAGMANAQLVTTRVDTGAAGAVVDGINGLGEYGNSAYVYSGGGSGFGGTLGNSQLYMDSDATNLYIGFQPGADLNDLVTILLDTRAGGFTDAGMSDNGDGGRRVSSNLSLNADDAFPAGFLADYSIVIGSFGIVSFELTGGGTDGSLNFVSFSNQFTGTGATFREFAIPLASIGSGLGQNVDFFGAYIADSGFGSNESLPASAGINGGANPGFDATSAGYQTFHRFTTVPTPGAAALLGIGGLLISRRRRGA